MPPNHDTGNARGPTSEGTRLAPSPSAQELADSLRAGVAVTRRLTAEDQGEDAARLGDLGDLEGLPPVAKPGAAAPLVRRLRGVLRAFLRPWLAAQTIFNREIARRFQAMVTVVRDLDRRLPGLEQSMQHLEARLLQLERGGPPAPQGDAVRPEGAGSVERVERMFVHSRLPRPPARVLLFGSAAAAVAPELTSFGFDVTVRAAHRSSPLADAAFDVVIHLAASEVEAQGDVDRALIVEASRVLASRGRLLLSLSLDAGRGGAAASERATLASLLEPLSVAEALPQQTVLLIDARRSDAPDR